jgi:hypothetical protein
MFAVLFTLLIGINPTAYSDYYSQKVSYIIDSKDCLDAIECTDPEVISQKKELLLSKVNAFNSYLLYVVKDNPISESLVTSFEGSTSELITYINSAENFDELDKIESNLNKEYINLQSLLSPLAIERFVLRVDALITLEKLESSEFEELAVKSANLVAVMNNSKNLNRLKEDYTSLKASLLEITEEFKQILVDYEEELK